MRVPHLPQVRSISWLAAIAAPVVVAGSLITGPLASAHATTQALTKTTAWPAPLWSTQLDFDNNGTAWSESSFAKLKADGLTTAEIDMPWNTIEPARGTFSFGELDQELANASAAGMKLVLIFWYSGWGGSPASWVTSHEVNSSGAQGTAPAWWDPMAEPAYLTYVTSTIKHVAGAAGYGGSILNYGDLDAQWDDGNGNAAGWAQDDINKFHDVYLPDTYRTIAAFNAANHTSYTAFSQVPAATPGQPLANVYQQFRVWSVRTVYAQLTSKVRAVTSGTPLYYYFGGHIGNGVTYANIPDLFFSLARQYRVTVIEDAAQSPGLALLFGSLGRTYGVHVAMEWTAPSDNTQLAAQAVQWIDNYGMAMPDGGGEDFFIHDGTEKDVVGFPIYINWLPNIRSLSGSYPRRPVAVYIDYSQAYGNASGGNLGSPENEISSLWDDYQAGFAVVTSQEVDSGIVKLSSYKAVLPTNGVDANLNAYKAAGGHLLTTGSQLSQYAPAYASLANSGTVQIVPVVSSAKTSAQLTLANVTSGTAYHDSITFSPAGLGLASGTHHVVDASGVAVSQKVVSSGICTEADIPAASLVKWRVVPGAAPAGTPAPSNCADSAPVPCGTLTANHELATGQSLTSCNGDYTLIMQGDGNLVLYQNGTALWASNTSGSAADEAIMQGDGNFVLYTSSGSPVWASGTAGHAGSRLVVQNNGDVVIYSASGSVLWSTGTKDTLLARAATAATYGEYALMFAKSAGQYYSGGTVAGQWAWSPQTATTSDISWGDPATWPPKSAEHFIRNGNWVVLAGYSDGQGQPVTEVQRVTSDKIGNVDCQNMRQLPADGHLEYYVKWVIPAAGYCLDAVGTITSTVNGSVVHFEHEQQWSPPTACSNAYFTGQVCITQHERWWDDNGHPYGLQLDRTQYIARGRGMAFEIRQTYPISWAADGRYYWTW